MRKKLKKNILAGKLQGETEICESVWLQEGSSVKQCSPNFSLKIPVWD